MRTLLVRNTRASIGLAVFCVVYFTLELARALPL